MVLNSDCDTSKCAMWDLIILFRDIWLKRCKILPTAEQGIRCVILCQSLTNVFAPIFVVRLDERTGNVFILAGDNIEIEIYRNGLWRFL
jgi:hypothetical protein